MDLNLARRVFVPPLSFFWVVEWVDGRAMMQFDPNTGKENRFSEVVKRNKLIRRAAWMPFPPPLASKVEERVLLLPVETLIGLEIPADGELLLRRRVYLPLGTGSSRRLPVAAHVVGYKRGLERVLLGVDSLGARIPEARLNKIGWSIKGISPKGEIDV